MNTLQRSTVHTVALFNAPYEEANVLYGGHLTESRWFQINQNQRKFDMKVFCRALELFHL